MYVWTCSGFSLTSGNMSNFVKVSNSHFQFWAELNLVLKWIITHTQCNQMARFFVQHWPFTHTQCDRMARIFVQYLIAYLWQRRFAYETYIGYIHGAYMQHTVHEDQYLHYADDLGRLRKKKEATNWPFKMMFLILWHNFRSLRYEKSENWEQWTRFCSFYNFLRFKHKIAIRKTLFRMISLSLSLSLCLSVSVIISSISQLFFVCAEAASVTRWLFKI